MNYQTFQPHPDLKSLIKCYWTLEVPAEGSAQRQRILPDGCIELIFILGDDIKSIISEEEFTIQPRAMVLGQITEPYFVEPTGYVHSFAVRFYPHGFANFVSTPIKNLANKETPVGLLFGDERSEGLTRNVVEAADTAQRIAVIEAFLFDELKNEKTIDHIVKSTIEVIFSTKGSLSINSILRDDLGKRRQIERKFLNQTGISPKQLGKIIRLQTALKMLLMPEFGSLTKVAYESQYYDQAHFNRDFKEFAGVSPREFLGDDTMRLSALFYSGE